MKKILIGLLIAFLMSMLITPIALAYGDGQDPPDLRQRIFIHYARGGNPGKGGGKTGIRLKWVNPKDGDIVSGEITVQIEASDKEGIINVVEWKVNTEDYKEATYNEDTGYYEERWVTTEYADGDYKLTAKATDNEENTKEEVITVTVSKEEEGYYKLMGVKWHKTPVKIEVNPSNPNGFSEKDVRDVVGLSAEEWDDGDYSGEQWDGVPPDLFDDTIATTTKTYDDLAWRSFDLDGANTIVWGNYRRPRVIAVTIVWYDSRTMEIVEFDMVLDTDFDWSLDAQTETGEQMDLQNIVTHELGHGAGLDDLTQDAAYQETMYAYADYDEIIKRDLYIGDKEGITELYA